MVKKKALKPRKAKKPVKPRWTLKQRSFVVWYVSAEVNGNGTESARRAGYKGNDVTLAQVAAENLKKPHIAAEIAKLQKEALKAADITIEKVLTDLENSRKLSLTEGQYASAVRCSELQGKYLKMFVDKIEHVQTVEDVTEGELVRLLKEIVEAGGIDISELITGNGSPDGVLSDITGTKTTH